MPSGERGGDERERDVFRLPESPRMTPSELRVGRVQENS